MIGLSIGEPRVLPDRWVQGRFKHLVRIRNGQDYKTVEDPAGQYPVIGSGGEFARASSYLFEGESVLLGRKGTIDKPMYVNGRFWTVDTMFYSEIAPGSFPKFVYYLATTLPFDQLTTRTALPSMTQEALSNVEVLIPPFDEQRRIAAFLDHETARIDELVHEQQRLIGLLREKRQALVRTAMTKGLNPSAPMKDSGEGGIGIVPCHWKVAQLKYFFDSLDFMRVPLKSEDRGKRPGKYPYYGASGIIDFIDDYIFSEDLVLVSEDGANLLLRSTPIAFVARGQYWVNNHAHILRPRDGLVEYWAELIEQMDITVGVTGSAQPKLTSEALGALIIATPPDSAERRAIASHIATASADLDSLIRESSFVIDLLVERRSALISAAVTGQLDLRNWQPSEQEAVAEVA